MASSSGLLDIWLYLSQSHWPTHQGASIHCRCHARLCDTGALEAESGSALAGSGDLTEIASLVALIARRP
jgi:hypothetical protein